MLLLLDFLKNWNTIQQQLEANDLNLNLTETCLLIRNELPTLKIFQQQACLLFANHNRSETVVLIMKINNSIHCATSTETQGFEWSRW